MILRATKSTSMIEPDFKSTLGDNSLTISRQFPHARQRVYSAFTRPSELQRWFSPSPDIGVNVINFDCEIGGRFTIAYSLPDAGESVLRGVFQEVITSELLVFTWCWDAPDQHANVESLVRVTFEELTPNSCQVVITHTRLTADGSPQRHRAGWEASLARLVDYLTDANKD